MKKIGILSLQGDVSEHVKNTDAALENLGIAGEAYEVKTADAIKVLDALIIPGGESTTLGKLIKKYSLGEEIIKLAKNKKPIMGTCAGLILLGTDTNSVGSLDLLDIEVSRNAFGRQRESFEADLEVEGLGVFHAVFIRAPAIEKKGEGVKVLSIYGGRVVAAEKENLMVFAFHPELGGDTRIHERFLKKLG